MIDPIDRKRKPSFAGLSPGTRTTASPDGISGSTPAQRPLWGQTRRFRDVRLMSGLPPTADVSGPGRHFAFGPESDARTAAKRILLNHLAGAGEHGGVKPIRVCDRPGWSTSSPDR